MAEEQTTSASFEKDEAPAAASTEALDHRQEIASRLVSRFAIWAGVAGFIPLPFVDVLAVGGLQLQMLRRISQIYDVKFSDNSGKAIIASTAGSMISATSGIGAASMLKTVPVLGRSQAAL